MKYEFVRIINIFHRKCIADDCVPLLSKSQADFFVHTELHLVSICSPRVAASHGTCESGVHISSEKMCELKGRKYSTL